MQSAHIVREITTPHSFRVAHVASLFDVPLQEKTRHEWDVSLPLDEKPWHIGLIVGPSGCGKSTIARELWPEQYRRGYEWNEQSILDNFPKEMESRQVVATLTSVGFSSPPDWVKPYAVLSTGQQMRCDLARALCVDECVVFDEFTSVVDRTVAKIGSAALAKAIRKQAGRQFIAVTCHEDVVEWLTPDWTYEPHTNTFQWRFLQRPAIHLEIYRVHTQAWQLFGAHHYLSHDLPRSATCYVAEWEKKPVGFVAVLPVIGFKNAYRESRIVVLPDYQGIGIGTRLSACVAQMYVNQGKRYRSTTSHPGFIAHRNTSNTWSLVRVVRGNETPHGGVFSGANYSRQRCVATFEYVGTCAEEVSHAR
jgi:ABC-type ATPase involved in cell division/GNAT superfamily N-acetyltransferase